jgi:hypothetical protein
MEMRPCSALLLHAVAVLKFLLVGPSERAGCCSALLCFVQDGVPGYGQQQLDFVNGNLHDMGTSNWHYLSTPKISYDTARTRIQTRNGSATNRRLTWVAHHKFE